MVRYVFRLVRYLSGYGLSDGILAGIRSPEGLVKRHSWIMPLTFQPRLGIIQNMGAKNTILNIMDFPDILYLIRLAGHLAEV